MTYLKLGKLREAERDASKSLQLQPAGNPKALFRRGLARKGLGKVDLAREGPQPWSLVFTSKHALTLVYTCTDFVAALKEEPANSGIKTELDSLAEANEKSLENPQEAKTPVR